MQPTRFQWVFCQLELLQCCPPSELQSILQDLPASLDETYKCILMEIKVENQVLIHHLLQCLLVSMRPLSIAELGEVLAFEFDEEKGGIPKPTTKWQWEDHKQVLLSACSSLITIVRTGDLEVIQLSHLSVKEFLTSNHLKVSERGISYYHIVPEDAHTAVANACIGALLRSPVDTKGSPLAQYAARYWVTHAQVGHVASRIHDGMISLFDLDKPYFSAWVKLHNVDSTRYCGHLQNKIQEGAEPLYYASLCGFLELVEHLVQKHPQYKSAIGGGCGTAAHVASLQGHVRVLQLLLLCGVDVDVRGLCDQTPLHFASIGGHLDVVRYLLIHDADPNLQAKSNCDKTPLHRAAVSGNADIVQVLLEHNADSNSRGDLDWTPLHHASRRSYNPKGDYPRVVQLLLKHNADPNARDTYRRTPFDLVPSSSTRKLEVARILLEHGADGNIEDKRRGRDPFAGGVSKRT
jgi:hypothetical protein